VSGFAYILAIWYSVWSVRSFCYM